MKEVWVIFYDGKLWDVAETEQMATDYVDLELDIDQLLDFTKFQVVKYTK